MRRISLAGTVLISVLSAACASDGGPEQPSTDTASTGTVASPTAEPTGSTVVPGIPPARGYAMMADLPSEPGVVMLGGASVGGPPNLPDMWWFRPTSGWQEITQPAVPQLLSLGEGIIGTAFEFDPASGLGVFADIEGNVWVFDPAANGWEPVDAEPGPSALLGTSFIPDAGSRRMIAFGGFSFGGGTVDETWSYDLDASAWVEMSPGRHPSARNYYQAAYDPVSDRVILFGGSDDVEAFDDTWAYDVDEDTWTELSPKRSPPARTYGWMGYDPIGERMILFGGTSYPGEEPMGDTWVFDPGTDTWSELEVEGPSPRGWHAMAYDAETELIVLFGGGESREAFTAETWTFDPRSDAWGEIT